MEKSSFLEMKPSVSKNMIDTMERIQASNESMKRDMEPGLEDISAFVASRGLYGSFFKNPVTGPVAKRLIIEPPLFRAGRKSLSKGMTNGSVLGSGSALASEFIPLDQQ